MLPLSISDHHNILLIGPNANAQVTMQGNYKVNVHIIMDNMVGISCTD